MRLPSFEYIEPSDVSEALKILNDKAEDCVVLAGGTDLIVRMKQRLTTPNYLLSLKNLKELSYIREEDGFLKIGAGTTLDKIISSENIKSGFPGFFQAVESVGAWSVQHCRGTISGNLCQENRCRFYNQSEFFRSVRQKCHKAGGSICYACEGSDRCRSVSQSDAASALISLNAKVSLKSYNSERNISLEDLYTANGEVPLSIDRNEILTEILIPLSSSGAGTGSSYQKLTYRGAIDYPVVSAAAFVKASEATIKEVKIVLGAVGSAPLFLVNVSKSLIGKSINNENALYSAAYTAKSDGSAFIVNNVNAAAEYRTAMISVLTLRALQEAIRKLG